MEFKGRRKGRYEVAGKFVEKMKRIQEEAKAALGKAPEEMKKFANRKRRKGEEYRVGDLVLLSTKDLKWQMKGSIRLANSKARIKPTALLSAFDKENSIEFPLDFSTLLIQLLHGLCTSFPCLSCDLSCDMML